MSYRTDDDDNNNNNNNNRNGDSGDEKYKNKETALNKPTTFIETHYLVCNRSSRDESDKR